MNPGFKGRAGELTLGGQSQVSCLQQVAAGFQGLVWMENQCG